MMITELIVPFDSLTIPARRRRYSVVRRVVLRAPAARLGRPGGSGRDHRRQ